MRWQIHFQTVQTEDFSIKNSLKFQYDKLIMTLYMTKTNNISKLVDAAEGFLGHFSDTYITRKEVYEKIPLFFWSVLEETVPISILDPSALKGVSSGRCLIQQRKCHAGHHAHVICWSTSIWILDLLLSQTSLKYSSYETADDSSDLGLLLPGT